MVIACNEADSPDPEPDRLQTVADVARRLNVSQSLVYSMVDSGLIGVLRIGRGRGAIRFHPEDISAYLESCRTGTLSPRVPTPPLKLKHIRVPRK